MHAQFETIHPYLDGNGRLGRMLIALLLDHWGLLKSPLLYLSLYFKQNQAAYYRRLGAIRTAGDWPAWLNFLALGIWASGRAGDASSSCAGWQARFRRKLF